MSETNDGDLGQSGAWIPPQQTPGAHQSPAPPFGMPPGAASPAKQHVSLVVSVAFGFAAGVVAAIVWYLITYMTNTVFAYAGMGIGFLVGFGFAYRAEPQTRALRTAFAVIVCLLVLFFAQYFIARQFGVDGLLAHGKIRNAADVPLILPIDGMFQLVGAMFSSTPFTYAVWGLALYVSGSVAYGPKAKKVHR